MPTKRMTAADFKALRGGVARPLSFDSEWEKDYWQILNIAARNGVINHFRRAKKPDDTLVMVSQDGKTKSKYTPDFIVTTNEGNTIYIEVKGRCRNGREDRAGRKTFELFGISYSQCRFLMVTKKGGAWAIVEDINPQSAPLSHHLHGEE